MSSGRWIYREADVHSCHRPRLMAEAPGVKIGDRWQCDDCNRVYIVTGFDSGMQWDPYPTVILWEDYEAYKSGPFAPGTK